MVNIVGKNFAQINIFRESDRAITEQKNLSTKQNISKRYY